MAVATDEARILVHTMGGERFTPLALAKKLGARAFLESASFQRGRERYSFLLLREAFRVFQRGEGIWLARAGAAPEPLDCGGDILDAASAVNRQHAGTRAPFPLPTGGIGYLAYEYCARFDTIRLIRKPDPLALPDAMLIFGNLFLVFDHYTDTISLAGVNYREREIDLARALAETEERINDLDFNSMAPAKKSWAMEPVAGVVDDRAAFLRGVETVRAEIVRGNLLQGVLSRRITVSTGMPALEAYRALRSVNPSPYMFYLDFDEFQLFGASPELHVKVQDGRATIRPLAGTRPRGADPGADAERERELLADEKERAEHLMLVDLARNDLGRVCSPASVRVSDFMGVERYSHVMHIVSQAEGTLAPGKTALDAMRATFPAGTVSGAPKIRAIEVIDGLEPVARGFYAGAVLHLDSDGSLDSCITIRSALAKGGRITLQAGAGIVYDSVPEREYEETEAKLGALAKAIGLERGEG
jgi:anthranilate synthase component 1